MKKLLIATIIFVLPLLSHAVFAQWDNASPEERAQHQTSRMKEELGLTDEQLPKVEETNLKYALKGVELRDEYQGDRQAMFTVFREVEKQKEGELALVLTEEQMVLWNKKQEEQRGQRRGRVDIPAHTDPSNPGLKINVEVHLNADFACHSGGC